MKHPCIAALLLLSLVLFIANAQAQPYSTVIGMHAGSFAAPGAYKTPFDVTRNTMIGFQISQRLGKLPVSVELNYDRWSPFGPDAQEFFWNSYQDEHIDYSSRNVVWWRGFQQFLDLSLQKTYGYRRVPGLAFPVSAGVTLSRSKVLVLDSMASGGFEASVWEHFEQRTNAGLALSAGADFFPGNKHLGVGLSGRMRYMPSFGAPFLFYLNLQIAYRFHRQ